jgi:TorA maturation chaperone TorD
MKELENQAAAPARAVVYKLLADCYYPPDERTLSQAERLVRLAADLCPEAGAALDLMAAGLAAAGGAAELAVDHARLFVGPFALLAPPYGSVYLDNERRLMGASALEVEACYREAGLELASGFNGTPDHVAAELEFMHFLAVTELAARRDNDPVRASRFRGKQRAFLTRHLGAWAPDFTRTVEEQAHTLFYRGLAAATRIFVASDGRRLAAEAEAATEGGGGAALS